MRVITGLARGRALKALSGDSVRPTGDRVKEGIFSAVQFDIEGRRVLDLFAGSGQLGIEALSRGAAGAVFVDADAAAAATVRENLLATNLSENAQVVKSDALAYLRTCAGTFGLIFIDPPYQSGLQVKCLELCWPLLAPGGSVICETAAGQPLPEKAGELAKYRSYRYGKTAVTIYRRDETP